MTTAATLSSLVNSSNRIVVPSGGLDFGTTTSGTGTPSSGLLDDYEEGTWTPEDYNFDTWTNVTFDARYTKTGNLVQINIKQTAGTISWSAHDNFRTLPFAPVNTSIGIAYHNSTAFQGVRCLDSNSKMYMLSSSGGNCTDLHFTVTYLTS